MTRAMTLQRVKTQLRVDTLVGKVDSTGCHMHMKSFVSCHIMCLSIGESDGEEVWDCSEESEDDLCKQHEVAAPDMPKFSVSKDSHNAQSLVRWLVGFLAVLQARYHIPNAAIDLLVKFISLFLAVVGRFSPFVCHLYKLFPSTLHMLRKEFSNDIIFRKYVVCPKCTKVYTSYESCINKVGSVQSTKLCSHIEFRQHPHHSKRRPCGAPLLKSVQYRSGQEFLYPFKIYCYTGFKTTLQKLLMTPSFLVNSELWRS